MPSSAICFVINEEMIAKNSYWFQESHLHYCTQFIYKWTFCTGQAQAYWRMLCDFKTFDLLADRDPGRVGGIHHSYCLTVLFPFVLHISSCGFSLPVLCIVSSLNTIYILEDSPGRQSVCKSSCCRRGPKRGWPWGAAVNIMFNQAAAAGNSELRRRILHWDDWRRPKSFLFLKCGKLLAWTRIAHIHDIKSRNLNGSIQILMSPLTKRHQLIDSST